jgi:hypothetical protein
METAYANLVGSAGIYAFATFDIPLNIPFTTWLVDAPSDILLIISLQSSNSSYPSLNPCLIFSIILFTF